jgi:hypothetical protein
MLYTHIHTLCRLHMRGTCFISPLLLVWPGAEGCLVFSISHRRSSPPEAGLVVVVTVGRRWTGSRRDMGVRGTRLSASVLGAARSRELADASLWYPMSVALLTRRYSSPRRTPLTCRPIRLFCRASPAWDWETALHPASGGRLRFHCQPCYRCAHGGRADSCRPILLAPTGTLPV